MNPDRMSWHARERYLAKLRAEIAAHEQQVAALHARIEARAARLSVIRDERAEAERLRVEATTARAEAILATLPPDPEAEHHRITLWQALTRKDHAA